LDLKHYQCNDVYRPWVSKGGRRTHTLRNHVVRKNGRSSQSPPPSRPSSTYGMRSGGANVHFLDLIVTDTHSEPSPAVPIEYWYYHFGQRTTSPERQFECEGWCRTRPMEATPEHADVISISSSADGQFSWAASTGDGGSISMTTYLIDILKNHPEISISELMTRLNHAMHSFTREMHRRVQIESRARRKGDGKNTYFEDTEPEEESRGEMNNFQDIQLGSLTPVDMDQPFPL